MKNGTDVAIKVDGEDIEINVSDIDNDSFEEYIEGAEYWSMEVDFTFDFIDFIDFDETWFIAYQSRMYAEMFRN